jgi:hypothetical protein
VSSIGKASVSRRWILFPFGVLLVVAVIVGFRWLGREQAATNKLQGLILSASSFRTSFESRPEVAVPTERMRSLLLRSVVSSGRRTLRNKGVVLGFVFGRCPTGEFRVLVFQTPQIIGIGYDYFDLTDEIRREILRIDAESRER